MNKSQGSTNWIEAGLISLGMWPVTACPTENMLSGFPFS
jgi:hypothetical protein